MFFSVLDSQFADAVREISTTLPSEARNVFLRTPEGLETPAFKVLKETDEVRKREDNRCGQLGLRGNGGVEGLFLVSDADHRVDSSIYRIWVCGVFHVCQYQIRQYDSYTICSTKMSSASSSSPVLGSPSSTGTAFNTLASYLFGYNARRESMAMTTPVEIRKAGADSYTMSFVMPSKFTTGNAPAPNDDKVTLSDTANEVVATKEFPGEECSQ